ncbi:hypothetical protein HJC23_007742 [Cyclotella cryptica]|uniref:phosphoribosylaminoimidazole carboxylase n=1 Tax=Cyclotella cryptica TaxID=29204 RepID=A0ABD3R5G6_9STRA|eukprot:CCRYP_000006-RA/>CCRYP_000006-RA protein AED:0.08 eAED:-0.08 QI:0/-1/0/1/-1/1/1/0/318
MTMSKGATSSYRLLHGQLALIRGNLKNFSPAATATAPATVIGKRSLVNQSTQLCAPPNSSPHDILTSFANLDHRRASRAGFPEAVFGQGKTPTQIHAILESMAKDVNQLAETTKDMSPASTAIIATRIDPELYHKVLSIGPLKHGSMEYHETARILSVRANSLSENQESLGETASSQSTSEQKQSVVVACAGTTDLPVAEEAAVTLSLSGVPVTRVYDCGVAGLHRIISALPKLRDPNVGCVIVCAGMDGALPSVVGGLVDVPVVAIPTSVGYGMSLGGMSALLTMLNSCSPGVGVVNVDNGFGGAVWALKCLRSKQK